MIRYILLAALALGTSPISALEFGEERDGWTIVSIDGACVLGMDYEGPGETSVMLLDSLDEGLFLAVANYGWSAKEGETYDVAFALNGTEYGGAGALGTSLKNRNGFMAKMNSAFATDFAAGRSLHVYLNGELIDRLSLTGTGLAVASLQRCMTLLKRERTAEQREKAKWADLPTDPFATAPSNAPAGKKAPAAPSGNPGTWANLSDYPSVALRAGAQGKSQFVLVVSPDGRAKSCEITASSGSNELDAATCTLMMRRARFSPARDESGTPIEGHWSSSVSWEIPAAPPLPPPPVTCVAGKICTRGE